MKNTCLLNLLLITVLAGCGQKEPLPAQEPSMANSASTVNRLPPDARKQWDEAARLQPLKDAQQAMDRAELTRPAPTDFKPEAKGRKVRIKLFSQKAVIRAGESLWYRVEFQNVGTEEIYWYESPFSFFKSGFLDGRPFELELNRRGGAKKAIWGIPVSDWGGGEITFPAHFTDADKVAAIQKLKDTAAAGLNALTVTLQPGESLITRAWKHGQDRHPEDRATGAFRELDPKDSYSTPGHYQLQVVFRDLPLPQQSEEVVKELEKAGLSRASQAIDRARKAKLRFGLVESNEIDFEVAR